MKIGRSTECCERRSCKRIRLPAPTMTSLFPGSLCGLTPPPSPVPLRVRVHPLVNLASPSEHEPFRSCPARCRAWRLPWGFFPHRGISMRSPLSNELPRARTIGPSSAFLTPSTACSSAYLAGLFHPTTTSGIHLSGVLSRYQARPPRRRPVPSCRSFDSFLPPSCPDSARPSRPVFRVLIRAAIRSHRQSD